MTLSLFDTAQAERACDRAVKKVESNACGEWMKAARAAIKQLAMTREEFTTDAVWFVLENRDVPGQHEPRAMGAAMRYAARMKWIQRTDRTRPSVRVSCHRRPLAIWRSQILQGAKNDQ